MFFLFEKNVFIIVIIYFFSSFKFYSHNYVFNVTLRRASLRIISLFRYTNVSIKKNIYDNNKKKNRLHICVLV